MILYLFKKYLLIAIVMIIALTYMPVIMGVMSMRETVPIAVLLSGIISPIVIYREFYNRKLWPLYHNLRLNKFLLLGLFSGIQIAISIGLRIWIR